MSRQPWNYEEALEEDRRFERRLPLKELATVAIVLVALAVRILFG